MTALREVLVCRPRAAARFDPRLRRAWHLARLRRGSLALRTYPRLGHLALRLVIIRGGMGPFRETVARLEACVPAAAAACRAMSRAIGDFHPHLFNDTVPVMRGWVGVAEVFLDRWDPKPGPEEIDEEIVWILGAVEARTGMRVALVDRREVPNG